MNRASIISLPMAVRVYTESTEPSEAFSRSIRPPRPDALLVFDTETTTDPRQTLLFGSYRFIETGRCIEEGVFYPEDLRIADRRTLQQYVAKHAADTAKDGTPQIHLLTLRQFLKTLYEAAYRGRCLLIGFNLPYDLSRLAFSAAKARGRFAGGFSFVLWTYRDREGVEKPYTQRPRILIKHIDSKRALKRFASPYDPDFNDLVLEITPDNVIPAKRKPFSGHFCDLRTFLFALTNDSHGLDSGCRAFGVTNGKVKVSRHGFVTEEYISYNRQDVKATAELAFKLFEEYDKHPIDLQETKAYSPASIGKSYLRAMGVQPRLQRQPDFSRRYLGYALSAFYGGRTSVHIRKVPLPVVYVDYSSMYPTVNCHLGLWPFVIAEKIEIVEHCGKEIIELMSTLTADDCFKPETWKKFTGFACVIPDGDILPNRGKYSGEDADWQVAVNILRPNRRNPEKQALWFSLPDIAVSVILTGKVPKIIDAFRIEARGVSSAVKSISLRGQIPIDARSEDFFKNVVEERNRVNARKDLSKKEKDRLRKFLKVLANAASYGIYAEMIREEKDKKIRVTCYGRNRKPFICEVSHPDKPGEFCFPPMAALITGGARLMLALLEHTVATLGGTYAMEDTDSMAIVATEAGGPVPCPGEPMGTDGVETIWALSWKQVEQIRARFETLNPYDRSAVPGSILKLEESNLNSETGERNQLYCYAISAKRYALFTKDANGDPQIVSCSQHGLGHLLNPMDLEDEERKWIERVWLNFVREALGLPFEPLPFAHLPAIGRVSVSSPAVMNPFAAFNAGKPYSEQIKPFNFYLTCWVALGEQPKDRIQLIAPYEPNPKKWLQLKWIDKYTGKEYRITTRETARQNTIRVKTYAEALMQYLFHPEAKYADASGNPCGKQTVGRLQRRHVEMDFIRNIGKESNLVEEVEAGIIHSPDEVYTEYPDPDSDEWTERILPAMREKPVCEWVKLTGFARRTINDWLAGRSRPHERNLHKIKAALLRTEA